MPCSFRERGEHVVQIRHQQIVAAVGQDNIDGHGFGDATQHVQLQSGNADEAGFSFALEVAHGGDGFLDNLFLANEFDIVGEEDVEIIGAQAGEGFIHAAANARGTEIESVDVVTAAFRGENRFIAPARERGA